MTIRITPTQDGFIARDVAYNVRLKDLPELFKFLTHYFQHFYPNLIDGCKFCQELKEAQMKK